MSATAATPSIGQEAGPAPSAQGTQGGGGEAPPAQENTNPGHGNAPQNDGEGSPGNLIVNENEKLSAFIERACRILKENFPDEEPSESISKLTGNRKRPRPSLPGQEQFTDTIKSCLKDLEKSTRVSFLLTLNNDHRKILLEFYNQQFVLEGPSKSMVSEMAERSIKTNIATWKYRLTENLIQHIEELNNLDERFRAVETKKRAIKFLRRKFSLDSFANIFDFVNGWIDLKGSGENVRVWCRALYIELGAMAKMHVNWRDQDDDTRLASSEYNRMGFAARIGECTRAERWKKLVPQMEDIKLCEKKPSYKKKKRERKYTQPDEDKDFYVPGETDSE